MLKVCLSECCTCFTHTLHVLSVFCIYFAMAFQAFSGVSTSVSAYITSVSTVFERILQIFYLDVLKVDQV